MPTRLSFIFQLTTQPADKTKATNHTAGWSESFWDLAGLPSNDPSISQLATARALLLPTQAAIIGYRLANYTISGNKLIPTGTSTSKRLWPGNAFLACDLPQIALEVSSKGPDGPNSSRSVLRGIPDVVMSFGEYQPDVTFDFNFKAWATIVATKNWYFLGRDLTVPAAPVSNIVPQAIVPPAPATWIINYPGPHGVVVGDYVRLNRCKDDAGNNIVGPFLVQSLTVGGIVVTGLPAGTVLTSPSGTIRKDVIRLFLIRTTDFSRAVVRKVGRPSAGYRGRQSKR